MLRVISLGLMLSSPVVQASAAQTLPTPSTWTNQRGSILTITTIAPTGKFEGTFVNNTPSFDCKGAAFPLQGKANGKRITFSVTWANGKLDCQSFTLWSGSINGRSIKTTWKLPYVANTWSLATSTGSDTFTFKK